MNRIAVIAIALAAVLLVGVASADEGAGDRATGFVAADPAATETIGGTETTLLLVATSIAVVVAMLFLLIGGAWSRRSASELDRLESLLEDRDA